MAFQFGGMSPSLGAALGGGFYEGVNDALQLLQQKKLMELKDSMQQKQLHAQQQNFVKGLSPFVGEDVAKFVGSLDPDSRKAVLQNIGSLGQLGSIMQPQQQQQSGMAALQQAPMQQEQENDETETSVLKSLLQQNQNPLQQFGAQGFGSAYGTPGLLADWARQLQPAPQEEFAEPKQERRAEKAAAVRASQPAIEQQNPQLAVPQQQNAAKVLEDLFTSPREKREKERLELEKEKLSEKKLSERFKATAQERKEIRDKARSAKSVLSDLSRLEELNREGKLDTPGYVELLKNSGLDIPALMNPESEEFQKISTNFLRDAKQYFGGRVSNQEMENFLKVIPSLSQSPQGRQRIIANLKKLKNADLAYHEAAKEVLRENKGVPPYDFSEQVDDKIDKKLDQIASQFKKDLAKPVPAAQNRMVTALQAVLGKGAALIPGAIKAGVGAFAGAKGLGALGSLIGGKKEPNYERSRGEPNWTVTRKRFDQF